MSCGPTYGQFVAWLHAAGLLPPSPSPSTSLTATAGLLNAGGPAIAAGTLVFVSGWDNVNNCPMVWPADPADLLTCATYLATATIPTGLVAATPGTIAKQGTITGLALVAAIGDPAYLAAAGAGAVQAGTTGLTTSNICQQVAGYFVTAGTSVYVDLTSAPVSVLGTSELQNQSVTPAKADLTQKWTWTGTHPQIQLGQNGVLGAIDFGDGGTKLVRVEPATFAANRTLTIPDPGANATFILSVGTTALQITSAAPQITIGDGAGVSGVLRLNDGTASVRHADITQATLAANRTYTVPDAGADATFILSQGTTAMTNTAASPQVTLGNGGVAGGLALRDGTSANAGTLKATTLTGARTYTFPNATGNVPVTAGAMVSLPQASYSNTNPANIRFGDVGIAPSTSSIAVTVTGVPDTSAASGSVVFVQFNGLAAAPGPVVYPGAFVLRASISGGTLNISLLNATTGAALAMGAATAMSLSYVILY